MARKFHNLAGWLRDVRAALAEGDQLAYELAEVIVDVDDLLDTGDVSPGSAHDGQDHLLDANSGEGDGPTTAVAECSDEDVVTTRTGMVRVAHRGQRRSDGVVAAPDGAGGGRPDGRTAVLTDDEFRAEARRRGLALGPEVRRGTSKPLA